MAMDVTVDQYLFTLYLCDLMHQLFCMKYFRVILRTWLDPHAVEIDASQATSVVATYYTIRIHARNESNQKVGEHLRVLYIGYHLIHEPLEDRASISLTRMHPCCDKDSLPLV